MVERLAEKVKRFKPGIPTEEGTTMGSLVSRAHFDRVMGFIDSAKQEGARVVLRAAVPTGTIRSAVGDVDR